MVKLKLKDIKRIRKLYAKGWTMKELAIHLSVSSRAIFYHINKKKVEE